MSDKASSVAFDLSAPSGEKLAALAELQKSHAPRGDGDLLDMDAVKDAVGDTLKSIRDELEEQQFNKSINPKIVPFPSNRSKGGKRGMQSVQVDDWNLSIQGEFWEKPGVVSFQSLRTMVEQTPVLNAVILTRIRQVQRFCSVAESNHNQPGFEIHHVDKQHQLSETERESIQELNRFIQNCGWEFRPRRRKAMKRDSFSQFMAKATRDSLTLDSCAIETEMKRDASMGIDGFYAVDGATIRLCQEAGYKGDDELFALQVIEGRISTAYTYQDLIYEARNPRSDVRCAGYGLSETELMIRVVTGFLNAMTYNIKGFDSNAIPKGILHLTGNYGNDEISAFKRYWNAMVRGVNNAWALPVMVSKDQESKVAFDKFGVEFNEMYFAKWMTFLTSIICAIYGMSPSEINFDSFTGGSTSALSGSDTEQKLTASKDSGLRPVLSYFQNLISDYIIGDFSDKYCFRWTGLDPEDADKKHEVRKLVLTINEMRAEEGYEAMEGPLGDAPANPSLIGVWSQMQQAEQGNQDGQGDQQGAEDFGTVDEEDGNEQGDQGQQGGAADGSDGGGDGGGSDEQGQQGAAKPDFGKEAAGDFGKSFGLEVIDLGAF